MKNKEKLIKTAIKFLRIQAVLLLNSSVNKKSGFSPSNYEGEVQMLSFHGTESCNLSKSDESDDDTYAYTYSFTAGIRLVEKKNTKDDKFLVQIEAKFEAIYLSDKELKKDCIQEFGDRNVQIHVWPYWREYVQSTCMRMGINPIPVPLFAISNQKNNNKDSDD